MDRIILKSNFIRNIVAKLIIRYVKKSLEIEPKIDFHYLDVKIDDEISIKLDTQITMTKEDFMKIVTKEL